jgi:hypothetical protein
LVSGELRELFVPMAGKFGDNPYTIKANEYTLPITKEGIKNILDYIS